MPKERSRGRSPLHLRIIDGVMAYGIYLALYPAAGRTGRTPACLPLRPPSLLLRIAGIQASPRWQEPLHRRHSRRVDLSANVGRIFQLGVNIFMAHVKVSPETKDAGHFSEAKPAPDRVTSLVHGGSPP